MGGSGMFAGATLGLNSMVNSAASAKSGLISTVGSTEADQVPEPEDEAPETITSMSSSVSELTLNNFCPEYDVGSTPPVPLEQAPAAPAPDDEQASKEPPGLMNWDWEITSTPLAEVEPLAVTIKGTSVLAGPDTMK